MCSLGLKSPSTHIFELCTDLPKKIIFSTAGSIMEFILFLEQMKKSIAKRKEIPTKSLEGSTQAQPQK